MRTAPLSRRLLHRYHSLPFWTSLAATPHLTNIRVRYSTLAIAALVEALQSSAEARLRRDDPISLNQYA
jgi:hypothetical protein